MVIKKEETYVLKLTEYREISNILKTGDINLVSKLMEDLKDIAIRCKKVSKKSGVKTFVDYINTENNIFSYVSVFYNYKEKVFRAKVRHDKFKDNWCLREFLELKDMFSQVGVEVNATGKASVEKILKIFIQQSLNKMKKQTKFWM